jgi:membrane-bound metal-dependent hydrolase YbcI (DUF457 family)
MFAIDHAATALVVKRRYPDAPLPALLLATQLMELLWVIFNLLGLEHVTTEDTVRSVADVHLSDMPWSHSLASAIVLSLFVALLARLADHGRTGMALAVAVFSHFVLDAVTHDHDLALAPMLGGHIGLGLYGAAPMLAFVVELAYGAICWRIFGGSRALLALIIGFNLANLSFFSAAIPGPEQFLAHRPTLVVLIVLVQIVVTLSLVGWLAKRPERRPVAIAAP